MTLVHSVAQERSAVPGQTEDNGGSLWAIGTWLSAALDDPNVCAEMKRDIREWFAAGGCRRAAIAQLAGEDMPIRFTPTTTNP